MQLQGFNNPIIILLRGNVKSTDKEPVEEELEEMDLPWKKKVKTHSVKVVRGLS